MKKSFRKIIALFIFSSTFGVSAQNVTIELVPLIGTVFQSTYYGYNGRLVFNSGLAYGGMLNVSPNKNIELGLNFINQESEAHFSSNTPLTQADTAIDAGIANYQLSVVRNFMGDGDNKVIPFAGMDIGAAQFYERKKDTQDYWRMSIGFKAGVKIQMSEKVNFRVQAQLEMPVQGAGVGVGIGTGGAYVGPTTFASIVQFGIMGGLGFRLK